MQKLIAKVCDDIKEILLNKNKSYGNNALNPVHIFSKIDSAEQIMIRIDDKLSRIMRGSEYVGDDTLLDLIGYLILLKCNREQNQFNKITKTEMKDTWVHRETYQEAKERIKKQPPEAVGYGARRNQFEN